MPYFPSSSCETESSSSLRHCVTTLRSLLRISWSMSRHPLRTRCHHKLLQFRRPDVVFKDMSRSQHRLLQNDDCALIDVLLEGVPHQFENFFEFHLRLNGAIEELRSPHPPDRCLLLAANRKLLQLNQDRRFQPSDGGKVRFHFSQARFAKRPPPSIQTG